MEYREAFAKACEINGNGGVGCIRRPGDSTFYRLSNGYWYENDKGATYLPVDIIRADDLIVFDRNKDDTKKEMKQTGYRGKK